VTIGVRPEDLYESAPAGGSMEVARLPARVVAVEPLGAETLLVVALGGSNEELIARVGRDTGLSNGDRFDIALDTAAIHLFDSATTKAIV
jgi:multiple sugar transport system ATP-binding protein